MQHLVFEGVLKPLKQGSVSEHVITYCVTLYHITQQSYICHGCPLRLNKTGYCLVECYFNLYNHCIQQATNYRGRKFKPIRWHHHPPCKFTFGFIFTHLAFRFVLSTLQYSTDAHVYQYGYSIDIMTLESLAPCSATSATSGAERFSFGYIDAWW